MSVGIRSLARGGAQGGYYSHLQRIFLFNSLLVPLVPMLLVGALIIFEYDARYRDLVHPVASQLVEDADSRLQRARLVSFGVIIAAVAFIAYRAYGLSRKMTERIAEADREKQRLNEQMFQTAKLASIGELAAGAAHEINNPIAVMIEEAGWIRDLLDDEDEEFKSSPNYGEFKRSLEQIQIQGRRCKEITQNLLSFARRRDADTAKVPIKGLLEDLMSVVRRRAEKRGVQVATDIQEDLPAATISYSELQQVLFNLINNAFDAMDPDGGTLTVGARQEKNEIILEVEDTGEGIPPDQLGRVFDPFYTTKPVGSGTGLGLSICYGLVHKWGGRIRAESTPGQGTRFWFTIPLQAEAENQSVDDGTEAGACGEQIAT
jgi:two-component system NtrC family sensor kinase